MCVSLSPLKDGKVEVVSCQRQDEAPEGADGYPEEAAYEQPGDFLLAQADYLTEPQESGCQEAQTPEVLNGGSEHSHSLEGVCGYKWIYSTSLLCESVLEWISFLTSDLFV